MNIHNKLKLISFNYLKLNENKKKATNKSKEFKIKSNCLKFENKQFLRNNPLFSCYLFTNSNYLRHTKVPESKQKFKNFNALYFNYIKQSFRYFLEFILYNVCLQVNAENMEFMYYRNQNKQLNFKNYKKTYDILKNNNFVNENKMDLSLLNVAETGFLTFSQSFTSQIYFKKKFTKNFFIKLTTKNFYYSIEDSLNVYYAELWKQVSYFNFANFSNQKVFLEILFYSKNFTNQALLSLFYIAKKFILKNQFQQSVSKLFRQKLILEFEKVTTLKIFKNSKLNVFFTKKFLKTFSYYYFREFFFKNSLLKFQGYSLNFYFRILLKKDYQFKKLFPQFIEFKNFNFLNLNQILVKFNKNGIDNFSNSQFSKNKVSVFQKPTYSFFKNSLALSRVYNFSKQFSRIYFPFTISSEKILSSKLIINLDLKIIEKFFFEILQQTNLNKEKTVNLNQLKRSILYYFSPVISKNYFIWSNVNFTYFKNSILCFQCFNIWLKKHFLSKLQTSTLICFNSDSEMNKSLKETFPLSIFYDLQTFPSFYSAEEFFICQSFNKLSLKTNIIPEKLNQTEKVYYLKNLKQIIKRYSSQTQKNLIYKLTPYILSWLYIYQFNLKPYECRKFDKMLSQYLWRWSCRRHNNKSKIWIQSKYFFTLNKEIWFFGQLMEDNQNRLKFASFNNNNLPSLLISKKNLKVVYLPFHIQIHTLLHNS